MLSVAVLDQIPAGRAYGFDALMLDMLAAGTPATVRPFSGYWLDIGRPDDYAKAIDEFESMKSIFLDA
jgi:NDP-sugar pyrophosphorylase family protein